MAVSLTDAKRLVGWSDSALEIVWHVDAFALGWRFDVQSRKFLHTGDFDDILFGAGPAFVIAATGAVIRTGSGPMYEDAQSCLLEMADVGLPLDQERFYVFAKDRHALRVRSNQTFLSDEELKRLLS